jgi:hypothetical protein
MIIIKSNKIIILSCILVFGISYLLIFNQKHSLLNKYQDQNSASSSNNLDNWNTYDDVHNNYLFKYPASLSYEIISSGDLVFFNKLNSDYTSCNEGDKPIGYVVMGGPSLSCLKKADFIYHESIFTNQSNMSDIKNELIHKYGYSQDTLKDSKGRTWDIRFKLAKSGDPLIFIAFISRGNSKYNSVQFTSYRDDNQYIELFKKIVSTLVFES